MFNVSASVDAAVDPSELFSVVSDLGTYPGWLDIVGNSEPVEAEDTQPAWLVDLRAQMGPLRRSKRLRMVRTLCEEPFHARFERQEIDGRSHSEWVLTATIDNRGTVAELTMDLHYGGSLWIPALERILREEIRRSSERLISIVQQEA